MPFPSPPMAIADETAGNVSRLTLFSTMSTVVASIDDSARTCSDRLHSRHGLPTDRCNSGSRNRSNNCGSAYRKPNLRSKCRSSARIVSGGGASEAVRSRAGTRERGQSCYEIPEAGLPHHIRECRRRHFENFGPIVPLVHAQITADVRLSHAGFGIQRGDDQQLQAELAKQFHRVFRMLDHRLAKTFHQRRRTESDPEPDVQDPDRTGRDRRDQNRKRQFCFLPTRLTAAVLVTRR